MDEGIRGELDLAKMLGETDLKNSIVMTLFYLLSSKLSNPFKSNSTDRKCDYKMIDWLGRVFIKVEL